VRRKGLRLLDLGSATHVTEQGGTLSTSGTSEIARPSGSDISVLTQPIPLPGWAWFGALGTAFSSNSPQGYLHVSGFASDRHDRVLLSFDGAGLSDTGMARRDAMIKVIEESATTLVENMLRTKY
jgi:hypothetical protein